MPRVPTIHPTGSNAQALRSGYEDVGRAILELSAKIQATAPHARDYPQGTYHHAANEHMAQLAALDKVRIHYMELLEGVQRQIAPRTSESEVVLRVLSQGPATARNISRTATLSFTTVMTILRDLAKEGVVKFTASRWEMNNETHR